MFYRNYTKLVALFTFYRYKLSKFIPRTVEFRNC